MSKMRYNDYDCPVCETKTVTRNADNVVTPMFFNCKKCGFYMAQSNMFRNEHILSTMQDKDEVKATHEFYYDFHKGSRPNEQLSVKELE